MLDNKIIDFKNILFIKTAIFTIVVILLYVLCINIYNSLTIVTKKFADIDIAIKNTSQRIKVLYNDQKEIFESINRFDEIVKNQLFEVCLDKYNITNTLNNISSEFKSLPLPITANISQDISPFYYYNFNISNIANISSTLDFGAYDLSEIDNILKDIISKMPKNTRITYLNIDSDMNINPSNISVILRSGVKNLFRIHAKFEFNKILI